MDGNNLQFKLLSLNVRSVRTFDKRKCILNWLGKQDVDICFLQETYSSNEIEKQWKKSVSGEEIHSLQSGLHTAKVLLF